MYIRSLAPIQQPKKYLRLAFPRNNLLILCSSVVIYNYILKNTVSHRNFNRSRINNTRYITNTILDKTIPYISDIDIELKRHYHLEQHSFPPNIK